MRIMYIAPRFHTNQAAVMKGWLEHGDQVCMVVRRMGRIEDHSAIEPILLPYAWSFNILYKLYVAVRRHDEYAHNIDLRYGYPSGGRLRQLIREFQPDLIILREKSVYSMICNWTIRRCRVPAVIYNQSPLYVTEQELHRDWKHRLVDRLLPTIRITPVQRMTERQDLVRDPNAYFVPFIAEPVCNADDKDWYPEGKIRILMIGKFERRKNQRLLLDAVERLVQEGNSISLQIIGEVSNDFHQQYYDEIQQRIAASHHLAGCVTVDINVPHDQINAAYQHSDLFVLPSTDEPAAYSILEAMANSVPVICSTGNGTACYIAPGQNGDIFKDQNEDDLTERIRACINDRKHLRQMGETAYRMLSEQYGFMNYYNSLMQILEMKDCAE